MTQRSDTGKTPRASRAPLRSGGRPSNWLRTRCDTYLRKACVWQEIDAIIRDRTDPNFGATIRWLADRAYGKAVESVELSGPDREPLRVIYVDE